MIDDWHGPERTQARLITGRILDTFLAFARGDPRLNEWEQGFLDSMADIHRRTHGRMELSDKQALVILRMEDELGGLAAVYRVDEDHDTDAAAATAALDAA
jgi:hypothetical protein